MIFNGSQGSRIRESYATTIVEKPGQGRRPVSGAFRGRDRPRRYGAGCRRGNTPHGEGPLPRFAGTLRVHLPGYPGGKGIGADHRRLLGTIGDSSTLGWQVAKILSMY